jgi:CheY-like chemotaxis protein
MSEMEPKLEWERDVAAESLTELAQWPVGAITTEAEPGRPGPLVIVVDDNEGFRSMIRDWLADEGIRVVGEAGNGLEAVALVEETHPDLVLMDLQMPQMNGFEAARLIRAEHPNIQVIVLSAYGGPALKEAAEEAGVIWYLVKDSPPEMLWRTIRFAWTYKRNLEG